MKLNLLPTSAAKSKGIGRAIALSSLLVIAGIAIAVYLMTTSQAELSAAKDAAAELKPQADQVTQIASDADELIKKAIPTQRNIQLISAIDANVNKYPNFYNMIRQYIPAFFRTTAIHPTPTGANTVLLSITGIIKDQDQYNNLVLALLRIPGATNIQRQAIPHDDVILPNVLSNDLNPLAYKTSDGRIPADSSQRLDYYMQKGGVTGFQNAGSFGADEDGPRGAMPKMNEVTVTLTVAGDLQAPQVRPTLAQFGPAPSGAGAAAPAATTAAAPARGRAPGGASSSQDGGGD